MAFSVARGVARATAANQVPPQWPVMRRGGASASLVSQGTSVTAANMVTTTSKMEAAQVRHTHNMKWFA